MRITDLQPFDAPFPCPQALAWTLGLILAAGFVPPPAADAGLIVNGVDGNYTATVAGATSTDVPPSEQVPDSILQSINNPNMASITLSGNSFISEVFGLGENFSGTSHSNGFATAQYGSLHVFAHAVAQVFPSAYAAPGPGPFGASPYFATAVASFAANVTDTITLGGTLPLGTPVQFRYTWGWDSIITPSPEAFGNNNPAGVIFVESLGTANDLGADSVFFVDSQETGALPVPGDPTGLEGSFSGGETQIISGHAGDVLTESLFLSAGASAQAGSIAGQFFQEGSVDASHTAFTFFDPITPGLEIISGSGHDYSSNAPSDQGTVPEPSTLALALSGFALLAYRRRMRRVSSPEPDETATPAE